ncbi:hypothetical protein LUW74_10310 [Actinomadura madurae]|nr:hypothetical protein [Actinomadura madurae]URN03684.1 hypothetical protein LUW74_10310 [Actinomadura madurae]
MLQVLIQQDPAARSKELLRPVVDKHDGWLRGRKILLVPASRGMALRRS